MYEMLNYPMITLDQYKEYLDLIDYYKNVKTNSIPIRYYNINLEQSKYDEDMLLTFDKFTYTVTGIVYDVYEFTPAFYTSPIVNATTMEQDKDFSRFSTMFSIQIYTIPKVYIGDLVQFYQPNTQERVLYMVTNFRVPLNNFDKVPVYEIDLEPAPVQTSKKDDEIYTSLNIGKKYIYDYSTERYIEIDVFEEKVKIAKILEEQFGSFIYEKLDINETLTISYNGENYVFYEINEWVYGKISSFNKKFRHLSLYCPYGFLSLQPPINITTTKYQDLIGGSGTVILNAFDYSTYLYKQVEVNKVNINLDDIDIDSFNINNYSSDLEKVILLLYFIDKVAAL